MRTSNTAPRSDTCMALNKRGERCHAHPLNGSAYCMVHDPESRGRVEEGRRKGGRTTSSRIARKFAATSAFDGDTVADVANLLAETINQARTGQVDLKVATTVGYLANVLIRARETADLEGRIERIEKTLAARRRK